MGAPLFDNNTALSPFASGYRELATLGYHLVALMPGKKYPLDKKWNRWCDTAPTEAELIKFASRRGANIGIAMGSPAGEGYEVISIDIDLRDLDEIERLQSALPFSSMKKFGSKGETLFYRVPVGLLARNKFHRTVGYRSDGKPIDELIVEILGRGRQTAVAPSIHPETKLPYTWTAGPVAADKLPIFNEDDLDRFIEMVETLGWNGVCENTADPVETLDDGWINLDMFAEVNRRALANLQCWVPDLGLFKLRSKAGGYAAVATWRDSSSGRAMEKRGRKLSIDHRGIVDFGAGQGYSPLTLVQAAQGCEALDAWGFLADRMGWSAEIDEWAARNMPALDASFARKAKLKEQRALHEQEAANDGGADSALFTIRNADRVTVELPPRRAVQPARHANDNDDRSFPDALTYPPGLLGDMVQYIVDTAQRPDRVLGLGSALVGLGTIMGRRDATPTKSGTHSYIVAVAPSGAGKDHPQVAGELLLEAAVQDFFDTDLVGAPNFTSNYAVIGELSDRPLQASFIDEFGKFLQRVNSPKAGGFEAAIKTVMLESWGKSFVNYRTPASVKCPSKKIHAPAWSVFGCSTPKTFYDALQGDDRENGFLNRMLLLPSYSMAELRDPIYDKRDIPKHLVDDLRAVYRIGRQLIEPGHAPEMRVVPWEDQEAENLDRAFRLECDKSELEGFCVRSREMAGRLATIVAVGRNWEDPKVSVDDINWGIAVARWSANRMAKDAGALVADTQVGRERARILAKLNASKSKRVAKSEILQNLGLHSRDLDAHIRDLVDMGLINVDPVPPPGGGKPKVFLVAS